MFVDVFSRHGSCIIDASVWGGMACSVNAGISASTNTELHGFTVEGLGPNGPMVPHSDIPFFPRQDPQAGNMKL